MDVIIKFCFTRNVTGFQSSLIILLNQVKIKNSINVTTLICILSIENLSRTTQHSCLHAFDLHWFSINYVVCLISKLTQCWVHIWRQNYIRSKFTQSGDKVNHWLESKGQSNSLGLCFFSHKSKYCRKLAFYIYSKIVESLIGY